ncbi:Tyrosine-protein kinase [Aphelenchoides besseyi]|nr:Tyrosine-protein kinase [Aphelenchoides besseyi]
MFNRFLRSRRATDLTSRSRRTSNDDWTSGNPETTAIEQPTASPNTVPPASVMQGPTVIQPVNSEPAPVMDPSSPTPLSQTPTSTIQTPTTSCTPTASSTPTVSTLSNVSSSTRQTISGSLKQRRAANIRYVGIQALDKALLAETYYHGVTTREEVEQRLSRDGDFLVCIPDDTTQNQATVAIGVRYGGRVRFFVIGKTKRARFHITEKSFDSIPLLIQHYSSTREPLTHDLPIVIKNAIPLPSYIITHDRIRLGTLIGKGAFGYVFKATLVCGQKTETVAVKSLKGKSTNDSRQRALFLQEARTMREYHHVNIVNFIGIASQQEPLMLILEFCVGGSLLNYLRNNGPELSIATRFRFATEAAAGLRYLERCRCIHRDISQWNNDCRQQCLTTVKK